MKIRFAVASAALLATPAFAHPGHTEVVAGHTHTLVGLMVMGAVPALLVIGGIVLALGWAKRRND